MREDGVRRADHWAGWFRRGAAIGHRGYAWRADDRGLSAPRSILCLWATAEKASVYADRRRCSQNTQMGRNESPMHRHGLACKTLGATVVRPSLGSRVRFSPALSACFAGICFYLRKRSCLLYRQQ
jgi:hypothetical protein